MVLKSQLAFLLFLVSFFLSFIHFFVLFFMRVVRGQDMLIFFKIGDLSGVRLRWGMLLDFFSLGFLSFIILITIVVVFYSIFYMEGDERLGLFLILVILFFFSIGLLVLSGSLLGLIVGWDGLGVTSFLLVVYYNNVSSLRSGLLTIYTNRLGDIFLILSFYNLIWLGWGWVDRFMVLILVFSLFIFLSGLTKSAQLPFSSWLPAAIAAPTPVSSLVHSSTLVTAGVYIFIRFYYLIRFFFISWGLIVLSLATSFVSGVIACLETDIKRLVAISTLSQLGLIIFSISWGRMICGFFHIVSHALFKALLFLCCGFIILRSLGGQDIRIIGEKLFVRKSILFIVGLSSLSLCGFPFLSGFFSRDLIIEGALDGGVETLIVLLFFLSCVLSIVYRVRLIIKGLVGVVGSKSLRVSLRGFTRGVSLIILFGWSICLGKLIVSMVVEAEFWGIFLLNKLMGALFFVFFLCGLSVKEKNWLSLLFVFFTEIVFMSWFLGGGVTGKLRKIRKGLIIGESYWLETVGGQGVFKLREKFNIFFWKNLMFKLSFLAAWAVLFLCIYIF